MTERPDRPETETGSPVPADRLSRFLTLGGLAGGIAGRAIGHGLGQVARGRRPTPADLLFTPANAQRVARDLAHLRGAAMKVGQLLSMDAGDVLPPEFAAILERLREDASPMPPKQLRDVLDAEWGPGWMKRFSRFDVRPMAAASIGQVHRATTLDGRDVAIKVQFPGVRGAIDSDLRNIGAILRYSGVVPRSLDLQPVLDAAREQLIDETDYAREAEQLARFGDLLAGDPAFRVPGPQPDLTTPNVLAMDFIESVPLSRLADAPQADRDRIAATLIDLVLRELFTFRAMQTDPNLANFRYEPDSGRIVLLDFGAVRDIAGPVVDAFHRLMRAGLDGDPEAGREAALTLGLVHAEAPERHLRIMREMFDFGMEPIRHDRVFDFGASDLIVRLRDMGMEIGMERDFWTVPATDAIFVQRKVAGTYLIAARLKARVNIHRIVQRYA
ncbi:AarF/ABC1/UbiB kinase family protein [Rhodobacterales bacterium HKCCE3408]|nr:AarF/ABC1/UbiB kinase family protein [Rhodobacterales bacterium HKCCE3408]